MRLAIYDEDREALKNFARIALGPGDHLVVPRKVDGVLQAVTIPADKPFVIARAIVENHLKGGGRIGGMQKIHSVGSVASLATLHGTLRLRKHAPLRLHNQETGDSRPPSSG